MATKIFLSAIIAAALTQAGSLWIDKLYGTCDELSFPDEIAARAKFRKPIIFFALTIFFSASNDFFTVAGIFLLVLMTATDFEQYMLFDEMTGALAIIGAVRIWQTGLNVTDCALAAIIGGGIFFALALVTKGGLGGGDVKLVAALGLWLGCEKLFNVVLIATIGGGIIALLMILAKQKDRGSYFAYGPYFALAAIYELLTNFCK